MGDWRNLFRRWNPKAKLSGGKNETAQRTSDSYRRVETGRDETNGAANNGSGARFSENAPHGDVAQQAPCKDGQSDTTQDSSHKSGKPVRVPDVRKPTRPIDDKSKDGEQARPDYCASNGA